MKNNTIIRINNCIMILLLSLLIIIFMGLYHDFIFNNHSLDVVEIPVEAVTPNKCIFGIFTEVFKISNSSYVYYPSHFNPISIRNIKTFESISLLDFIWQEQSRMFKDIIKVVFNNLGAIPKLSN